MQVNQKFPQRKNNLRGPWRHQPVQLPGDEGAGLPPVSLRQGALA